MHQRRAISECIVSCRLCLAVVSKAVGNRYLVAIYFKKRELDSVARTTHMYFVTKDMCIHIHMCSHIHMCIHIHIHMCIHIHMMEAKEASRRLQVGPALASAQSKGGTNTAAMPGNTPPLTSPTPLPSTRCRMSNHQEMV